ncbi:PIN domain-containing protein [Rhizobium leguminosarum]|uniref:type II toxin-antitoxin system VapC family toxin n=1 Tax=Rhizobium TaxID=379 RepID=UPI0013BC5C4D|nr:MULTISPECIES: type II toxin-antitoxin system VapC family toxin [Rhizobium]MDV4160522.1 PIN domain-containing protein [Rhizobium leguminosarum]MDV4170251.1 PIN domain-containing protein [Rhizobium leguminosarum]NEJ06873.1 PIN domain-containing protein [Rhizobium ruizarguesonis]
MAKLLVDTNVISTAYLPDAPEWLWNWLESLPAGFLAVPWVALYETEYGIRTAQRHNPRKALELLAWFDRFVADCDPYPDMNADASRLLGRMAATPAMQHFFLTEERKNKNGEPLKPLRVQLGGDAILAALSIAHQVPIATFNMKDFVYIDRFFPLPGVYDPQFNCWPVPPGAEWYDAEHANDDDSGTPLRRAIP